MVIFDEIGTFWIAENSKISPCIVIVKFILKKIYKH
jgi:hypothetical protein